MAKGICLAVVGLFLLCSAASGELVDNGDGTVTDTTTGLVWQQAEAGAMTWEAALTYCEDLELAGHDDWRLPNRSELQSIVDYQTFHPAIDAAVFPGAMAAAYWSSTSYADNPVHAWQVDFNDGSVCGEVGLYGKSVSYFVRAVRGGQ